MLSIHHTQFIPHPFHVFLYRFKHTTLNPEQAPEENMTAAAAAYNVGGMAAFWTATTLHQQPNLERSPLISDEEWEELYSEADAVLKTTSDLFDFSIRHTVVADALHRAYSDQTEKLSIEKAPYAGQRDPHCSVDIQWTSIDVILGEQLMQMLNDSKQSVFQLKVRVLRMVTLRCISSSYSIHKYFIIGMERCHVFILFPYT